MKNFLSLILVLGFWGTALAQNPDGRSLSLHISPAWDWGNSVYDRVAPIWIPQTQVTDGYFVNVRDTGNVQYPTRFGIDVMLKVPLASFMTISVSYSYAQKFEEIYTPYNTQQANKIWYGWSLNGRMHHVGFTASFYNIFSVY